MSIHKGRANRFVMEILKYGGGIIADMTMLAEGKQTDLASFTQY